MAHRHASYLGAYHSQPLYCSAWRVEACCPRRWVSSILRGDKPYRDMRICAALTYGNKAIIRRCTLSSFEEMSEYLAALIFLQNRTGAWLYASPPCSAIQILDYNAQPDWNSALDATFIRNVYITTSFLKILSKNLEGIQVVLHLLDDRIISDRMFTHSLMFVICCLLRTRTDC